MGSPSPDKINIQLRSPLAWFLLQILRVTLTRPVVLWQLLSSVSSASSQPALKSGAIELTYIGVATDQRGKGMGKTLLHAFIDASRAQGYRSVVLSVETENVPAVSLYENTGFEIVNTFSEGRYRRHRMELTLA
jgi:ribosomal protein S18 acetylase RimI-like enzyme